MRILIAGSGLLAGLLVVLAQTPALQVNAQEKASVTNSGVAVHPAKPDQLSSPRGMDPAKEADIRKLMDLTGANSLGEQLMAAGMEQFRASVLESQPDNPRAKQFVGPS